jgi:hypothetical protein
VIHWKFSFFKHPAHHLTNKACGPNNSNIILFHNDPPSDPYCHKKSQYRDTGITKAQSPQGFKTFDSAPPTGDSPGDLLSRPRNALDRSWRPFGVVSFSRPSARPDAIPAGTDKRRTSIFVFNMKFLLVPIVSKRICFEKRKLKIKKAAAHRTAASKRWFHSLL